MSSAKKTLGVSNAKVKSRSHHFETYIHRVMFLERLSSNHALRSYEVASVVH